MLKLNVRLCAGLLLLSTLFFVGCQKDGITPDISYDMYLELDLEQDEEVVLDDLEVENFFEDQELRDGRCFTLNFPVTIVFPDGSEEVVGSPTEAKEAIKKWYENHGKDEGRPHLQLPFEVTLANGHVVTVENREQLLRLKKFCGKRAKRKALNRCLDLVYPVNVVLPNGDIIEIESGQEMKAFIKRWIEAHPMADKRPKLELPFEVINKAGETFVIESRADLKEAFLSCK